MATDTSQRIYRLRALIAHPRTGDNERAAAQDTLDRILANAPAPVGDRSYGARYGRVGRHTSLAGIADAIRADLEYGRPDMATGPAVAVLDRIAQAPAGIRYVVEASNEAGLVIRIENVPAEWGWHDDRVSPQLQELADAVAELMNGYNRTGSDIGTRFFGVVRAGSDTLAW